MHDARESMIEVKIATIPQLTQTRPTFQNQLRPPGESQFWLSFAAKRPQQRSCKTSRAGPAKMGHIRLYVQRYIISTTTSAHSLTEISNAKNALKVKVVVIWKGYHRRDMG